MILAPVLKQKFFDGNGNPLVGGKLYSYEAGTDTPLATYADANGDAENENPVELDANGEASIWMSVDTAYKFTLTDADDVPMWTTDVVTTAGSVGTASLQDGSVTTDKIADDAVGADELRDDAVTDGNRAVTTNHIRNSAVTAGKIATGVFDNSTLEHTGSVVRIKDGGVTQAKRASLGQQLSSSSSSFTTSSTSLVDVTNLSLSITTTGRPVFVGLIPAGSSASYLSISNGTGDTDITGQAAILRDGTVIARTELEAKGATSAGSLGSQVPVGGLFFIEQPAAGTYTYKVQAAAGEASTGMSVNNAKLVAYEL